MVVLIVGLILSSIIYLFIFFFFFVLVFFFFWVATPVLFITFLSHSIDFFFLTRRIAN